MVFSSVTFLFFFLPITLIGFFVCPPRTRRWLLLLLSLAFYGWGEGARIMILLTSALVTYLGGRALDSAKSPKRVLGITIGANLLLLGTFKYTTLLITSLSTIGIHLPDPAFSLPLGISFFTFQAISYLVDVYRKDSPAEKSVTNLLLYITLFPQLVAGPIVRYADVAKNLTAPKTTVNNITLGLRRFIIGLAKKVLIADQVATLADIAFAHGDPSISLAWVGVLAYAVQIYMDFSGYSDMAIGLGRVFGFTYPENFNYPYVARSVREFWRRWHMTLSTWIRDYLYIPLGGSRRGTARTYINLLIAFTLCGLWHGAAWTFAAWGLYYGILLSLERTKLGAKLLESLPKLFQHIYLILTFVVGWTLFRAETFGAAWQMIKALAGSTTSATSVFSYMTVDQLITLAMGLVLCMPILQAKPLQRYRTTAWPWAGSLVLLALVILTVSAQQFSPFIYFRF